MIVDVHETDSAMKSELVAALYATPGTIFIGTVTVAAVMVASALLTGGDIAFHAMATRSGTCSYKGIQLATATESQIGRLENLAMAGAWSTASLISAYGCYAILRYTYEPVAALAIAQTIG